MVERTSVIVTGTIVVLFIVMLVCVGCGGDSSEENCGLLRAICE